MRSFDPSCARRRLSQCRRRAAGAGACLAFLLWGAAQAAPPVCDSVTEPTAVVACALAHSPELRSQEQEIRVLAGQRLRARSLLPALPVVQVSFAGRRPLVPSSAAEVGTTFNWYLSLSQELEIAGQRGARVRAAEVALSAQERRVFVTAQEVASTALFAYYELLAAREAAELGRELARIAEQLAAIGQARAQAALTSPVDAHAASAEAARLGALRFEAERRAAELQINLAAQLGEPQRSVVGGSLDALPDGAIGSGPSAAATAGAADGLAQGLVEQALRLRGDVAVAQLEQQAQAARVQVLRRERVPNLTLTFMAQRDGFDEQVLGGGLAFPLPLPAPLGPSRAGEIAAAQAQVSQAALTVERVQRRVHAEVLHALKREQSYAAQALLFPEALAAQTRADLAALAQALAERTLAPREVLLLERTLVEFLLGRLEVRRGLALARIERLHATGTPLVPPTYRGQP